MKLIVCGGRNYRLTRRNIVMLNWFHDNYGISELVSGGCEGADQDAEVWAESQVLPIPIRQFIPDWVARGKAAGPLRNQEMADYVGKDGLCIAFPGGKGTEDMIRRAIKIGMSLVVIR